MSETGRYDKLGHLVYDDASGNHLVNDDVGGDHLVLVDTVLATWTRNPGGDVGRYKIGDDVSLGAAISEMQASSWLTNNASTEGTYCVNFGAYTVRTGCIGYDIFLPSSRYIKKATFNISAVGGGATWAVYWQTGALSDDWAWATANTPVTGTGTGDQEISINATCTDWLWFIITMTSFATGLNATLSLGTTTLYV